jgi:hypothetical protein
MDDAILNAAQYGRLEVLKLFKGLGIPWVKWRGSLPRAARHGHRAVLEWLLANGCPVDNNELARMEDEVADEVWAAAAAVEARAAAAPAVAPEGAGAAPAAA